jgi:transposase
LLRSEGLVVGLITAAGHPVLMAEPAGFNAARPRWGSAGTKSDAGDAFMLADYARTDGHRLRRVTAVADATRELGVLVRARTALVEARTAASNQLWAVLAEHWPGAAGVFQKLTSKIALAFLTDYPTPQSAAHLGEGRMHQFCRRHAYRGGKPPAELLKRLRAAPAAATPIAAEILAAIVAGFVAQIRVLNTEIARLEDAIAEALDQHPKAALLENLPRAGTVSLAQLIAEVGPLADRCHDPEQVAAICGAAPITRASGKTRTVGFRYAANKPARVAITRFAETPGTHPCGRRAATTRPVPEEPATLTPCGSSPADGSASSGRAGTPTPPTTPHGTEENNSPPTRLDQETKRTQALPRPRALLPAPTRTTGLTAPRSINRCACRPT